MNDSMWQHFLVTFLFGIIAGLFFGGLLGVRTGGHVVRSEAVKNGVAEWHVINQYGTTEFRWIKK